MDKFQKSSTIMVVLTTLASGINYLCQVLMGRVLSVESFGVMNTLFSLILILSVPGVSFNMLTSKQVAEKMDDHTSVATIVWSMNQVALLSAAMLFLVMAIASPAFSYMLHTQAIMVFLTAGAIVTGFLPYVFAGAFSGLRAFLITGLLSLVAPVCKAVGVVISAVFATDEMGKQTVIFIAIILGNLLAISFYMVQFVRIEKKWGIASAKTSFRKTLSRNIIYVNLVNFGFLLLMNADILGITIFAGSADAGMYSAAMMFGRIIYYFTTALVAVVLPYVSREKSQGGNPGGVFLQSLTATLTVALLCMVPVNVFPIFF